MLQIPLSFEFFPPKSDEGVARLAAVGERLQTRTPEFFSVTYGAGGSTRDRTWAMVMLLRESGVDTAPHLSCIGKDEAEVVALVHRYQEAGVKRLVALRGDTPSGMGPTRSSLRFADDLVRLIRRETGDHFSIEVAAYPEMHPQARSFSDDIDHFKRKIDAGADRGITQYFYNADAYAWYMEQLTRRGVSAPVVPGIMPITNYANLIRFSDNCGADIPRWIRKRLQELENDPAGLCAFGEDVVTSLCQKLVALGAPGLHFYTMNQATPVLRVLDNLS